MILVRRKSLFVLTLIFCLFIIFGEIKFFYTLQAIQEHTSLELKYEIENIIFAAITFLLVIVLFYAHFLWRSSNVLKKLDKMIDLSEYGKNDISPHLEKLGGLGERIKYLLHHYESLNSMRALKISSLSGLTGFLLGRIDEPIMVFNCLGQAIDSSAASSEILNISREDIKGREFNDLFESVNFGKIYAELIRTKDIVVRDNMGINGRSFKGCFIPIMNNNKDISEIVVIFEQGMMGS